MCLKYMNHNQILEFEKNSSTGVLLMVAEYRKL